MRRENVANFGNNSSLGGHESICVLKEWTTFSVLTFKDCVKRQGTPSSFNIFYVFGYNYDLKRTHENIPNISNIKCQESSI